MIRLFVGLSPPPELRRRLALLAGGIPGARWTGEANLHVTLRFIGEVDEATAHSLHDALATIRATAFPVGLTGLGTYGRGARPHTLWLGVRPTPPLLHLHDKIESALVRAGLAPEPRKFTPHLTLARLGEARSGRLQDFIAGNNLFSASFTADRFVLFSSLRGNGEPVYHEEMDYPLAGAAATATA